MTRRTILSLVMAGAFAVGGWGVAIAHEGHEHKVMGTVTMAAADHVMLKDKDGKDVTVYVKADTKIVKGKTAMKAADIKANMRVVVTAVTEKQNDQEQMVAKTIQLDEQRATP